MIAKVGWRILYDVTSLWAQVLRSKYKVGEDNWFIPKSSCSSTWRSVTVGLRDVVIPGLRWVLGDGVRIRFWKDKWMGNIVLSDLSSSTLPEDLVDIRVRDLWIADVGWDFTRIEPYLPEFICLNLRAVMVDLVTGARDRAAWGASQDGEFSVKSAYRELSRDTVLKPNMEAFFNRVWQTVVPERVRVYLWLVGSQVIMTNVERNRRHLCESSVCQVCKGDFESIIHVLRDCPAISGIWSRLVSPSKRVRFFSQSLLEWVFTNLGDFDDCDGIPWATLFGMVVWWAWKWRCGNIFEDNRKCRDRLRFVKDVAKDAYQAHVSIGPRTEEVVRVTHHIAWNPPQRDWVRLNTDGASRGNPGLATAGGVLRDAEGRWLGGFALNIGICSAPQAELWGVYYGLCLAWEKKIPRLELVVDSVLVVGFLQQGISLSHPLSPLVHMCYGLLSKDWTVHISHGYREANRLADGLANYAFSQPLGVDLFDSCPIVVLSIFEEDSRGTAIPRRVRL